MTKCNFPMGTRSWYLNSGKPKDFFSQQNDIATMFLQCYIEISKTSQLIMNSLPKQTHVEKFSVQSRIDSK